MRALIRYELDVDQPINLRKLRPKQKIYAGFLSQLHSTKFYQKSLTKRRDAARIAQIKKEEDLRKDLAAHIYRDLVQSKVAPDGVTCTEIVIMVSSDFNDVLDRVIQSADFVSYDICRVPENADLRRVFPKEPIAIRVTKKAL